MATGAPLARDGEGPLAKGPLTPAPDVPCRVPDPEPTTAWESSSASVGPVLPLALFESAKCDWDSGGVYLFVAATDS